MNTIYSLVKKYRKKIVILQRKQQQFLNTGGNGSGVYLSLQGEINAYFSVIEDLEGQLNIKFKDEKER